MNKFLVALLIVAIVFSNCNTKENFRREVFLGFELGSSRSEVEARQKQLYKMNQVKGFPDKRGVYLTNKLIDDKEYYSAPLFLFYTGDTIVAEMVVLYFDLPEYVSEAAQVTLAGNISTNLKTASHDRPPANMIKKDVLKKLEEKYGTADKKDTMDYSFMYHEHSYWYDKNGVDMELDYSINPEQSVTEGIGNASLVLKYKYNPKIKDKLFNRKSVY